MATKKSIAEQILLKIYGRASTGSDAIQLPEVILAVGQLANSLLKAQHFDTLKMGENAPENLSILEYPKQPLVSYGGKKAKCLLPAIPVSLIRQQGIWQVSTDEFFNCIGIPAQSGQGALIQAGAIISVEMGQWYYEPNGSSIIVTPDLTIDGIDGLYFRLIGVSIDSLEDYAPLPLPADLEAQLISQVYQSFAPTPVDKVVDNYSAGAGQSNQPPTK